MNKPKTIFVDFNNADNKGRIRLNTKGTLSDIKEKRIQLKAGLELLLDDEDQLSILGIIEYSEDENNRQQKLTGINKMNKTIISFEIYVIC